MLGVRRFLVCLPLLMLLVGCSSGPDKPAAQQPEEPAKPPEPVTAQYAFRQMYLAARNWAPDAEALRLSNVPLPEFRSQKGKAGAWQATFASAQRGQAKIFTYSVIKGPGNLRQGVFEGPEEGWSRRQGEPFSILAFQVDATTALETAMKRGAAYAGKHPDMPINFLLERRPRFPNPVWRVIWGESVGTSGYSILIDAATGAYQQTLR